MNHDTRTFLHGMLSGFGAGMTVTILALSCSCGAILYADPDASDSPDAESPVDDIAVTEGISEGTSDDGPPDDAEDRRVDDAVQPDEVVVVDDAAAEDAAVDEGTDYGMGCSTEWCWATCAEAGFEIGVCMSSGLDCYCSSPTACAGPFRGSNVDGRWVAYEVRVEAGAMCHISTCAEFTGDTYLMVSGAWNIENDDACGLGSELTTPSTPVANPLAVWVSCLSDECSWSITVDCTPACAAY